MAKLRAVFQRGPIAPETPAAPSPGSAHPGAIGGDGSGTGWALRTPDKDGDRSPSLLEATRRGGLGCSPVSRGICTRRQDRCDCRRLSEQLRSLPRPLALNVSFEIFLLFLGTGQRTRRIPPSLPRRALRPVSVADLGAAVPARAGGVGRGDGSGRGGGRTKNIPLQAERLRL